MVFPEERNTIIKTIHEGFGHLGINRLDYEIRRRGLYWNNLSRDVKLYVNNCVVCTKTKLNFSHKPFNKKSYSINL